MWLLGSTVKLARQCRKFLANEKKDHDLRKWAIEGLSYLSLDADVKEELCDDQIALAALFDLCKVIFIAYIFYFLVKFWCGVL